MEGVIDEPRRGGDAEPRAGGELWGDVAQETAHDGVCIMDDLGEFLGGGVLAAEWLTEVAFAGYGEGRRRKDEGRKVPVVAGGVSDAEGARERRYGQV